MYRETTVYSAFVPADKWFYKIAGNSIGKQELQPLGVHAADMTAINWLKQ